MDKGKKIIFGLIMLLLCAGPACRRAMTRNELESQLKKAMLRGLYENAGNDSSKVRFEVLKVDFYEDKAFYDCEFVVHLKKADFDTTGSMGAYITKDFKKMNRKY